jgi:hypothetical protein
VAGLPSLPHLSPLPQARAEMLLHNEIQYTPSDTKNLENIKFGELEKSVLTINYVFCSKKNIYIHVYTYIHPCFLIFSPGIKLTLSTPI